MYCNNNTRAQIWLRTHKRHPKSRPNGRAMGVSFVSILEKIDRLITAPHCTLSAKRDSRHTEKPATSNGSWCMGIKGEMSGTVLCHIYMRYVYIYELFIAFVSFYLPKFSASMFVWRFVCPSVCLLVCLSVRNFFDTGHSFWYIFTKLDPSMLLCHVTMPIVFLGQRSNN